MTEEERHVYAHQIRIAPANLTKAVLYVEIDDATNARISLSEAKDDIDHLLVGLPTRP